MSGKRWMIKNSEGLLRGPYTTEDLLKRIALGNYSGDEMISEYPGANWYPISKDPQFYDRLLEALARTTPPEENDAAEPLAGPVQEPMHDPNETTPTPAPQSMPAESVEEDADQFEVQKPPHNRATRESAANQSPSERRKTRRQSKGAEDIELVDVKEKVRNAKISTARKPLIVAGLILAAGLYLILGSDEATEERIHLLAPRPGQATLTADQVKSKIARSVTEYTRDTFSGYVRAQNELVQIIEGAPSNAEILALLCMTYYELWPFAHQDSADFRAISIATQAASAIDGPGMHASTCKVVDLLLKGRYNEARSLSNTVIEAYDGKGQPPIPFYYFMAILSDASGDAKTGIGFLQTAQMQWPQWIRAFVYQGQLFTKIEDYSEAAKTYRAVLAASPQHEVAKIELGLLEYKQFRNLDRGAELIRSALKSKERTSRRVQSRGYLGLAEIHLQRRETSEALAAARRAYSLDSTNSVAKNLVVQLGGAKELGKTRFKAYQLIAEGDQFFREGDCMAAQAHYKTAFEVDKKSAVAAMKAGECLWRLSLSTEAIEWMNKAIRADPKMIEAYVTLADYYSQRFNFTAAAQVLIQAQREAPKSYEVFRGFAMVELRRNNPKSAADYAKRALDIYDTDVEAHVIMAEALIELGADANRAFAHANRARELDPNNRRAQVAYGRSLAGASGTQASIDYFNELVKTYPLVNEYRLALGKQLMVDERYSEAERVFRELTQVDEKAKDAFLQLGQALRFQARYEEALRAYDSAAILDPSDAQPIFLGGLLYLDIGRPVEAQVQLQRVLRINRLYPLVHYNLGRAALLLGDAAGALREAKEERNVNPNLADAYLLAAEAYAAQGQFTLCVAEYQKAIKLRPQSASIYIKMAICYRKADQLDVAIAMLNQAAVQESGLPDIYRELGIIYEIKGEMEEAAKAYQQYFVLNPNATDRSAIEQRFRSLIKGR